MGVSNFEVHTGLEGAVAQGVEAFVDVGVKKGDDIFVDSKSNFNTWNKRVKKGLEVKKLLISARPNPKDVVKKA